MTPRWGGVMTPRRGGVKKIFSRFARIFLLHPPGIFLHPPALKFLEITLHLYVKQSNKTSNLFFRLLYVTPSLFSVHCSVHKILYNEYNSLKYNIDSVVYLDTLV